MHLLRICCATGSARPYGNAVLAVAHSCSQRKRHQSTRWRPLPLRWRWRRRRRWRRSARPALCQRSRSSARCPPSCSLRRARARRTRSGITAPGACIASPNDHHHVHTMKHTQTACKQDYTHGALAHVYTQALPSRCTPLATRHATSHDASTSQPSRPARQPVPLSLVRLAQRPHGLVGGEVGDRVVPRGRRRLLRGALRCMRPPQRHVLSAQLDRGYGITPLTYGCHSQARARVLRSSCAPTKCSTRRFSRSRHAALRTSISDRPPRPSS
jgi:hypothetical protein